MCFVFFYTGRMSNVQKVETLVKRLLKSKLKCSMTYLKRKINCLKNLCKHKWKNKGNGRLRWWKKNIIIKCSRWTYSWTDFWKDYNYPAVSISTIISFDSGIFWILLILFADYYYFYAEPFSIINIFIMQFKFNVTTNIKIFCVTGFTFSICYIKLYIISIAFSFTKKLIMFFICWPITTKDTTFRKHVFQSDWPITFFANT